MHSQELFLGGRAGFQLSNSVMQRHHIPANSRRQESQSTLVVRVTPARIVKSRSRVKKEPRASLSLSCAVSAHEGDSPVCIDLMSAIRS